MLEIRMKDSCGTKVKMTEEDAESAPCAVQMCAHALVAMGWCPESVAEGLQTAARRWASLVVTEDEEDTPRGL